MLSIQAKKEADVFAMNLLHRGFTVSMDRLCNKVVVNWNKVNGCKELVGSKVFKFEHEEGISDLSPSERWCECE